MWRLSPRPFEAAAPSILSVEVGGGFFYVVTFSSPVVAVAMAPDPTFQVAGVTPDSVAQLSSTEVQVVFGDGTGPGNPWTLTGQPNWLTTPVLFPGNGVTT